MGQTGSKPYNNRQMQQLKQLYSPVSKLSDLPGQPLYIQYVSSLQNKNNSYPQSPHQAFLELYSLQSNKSQKDVIQDAKIYDQRKHNFPWVVKVICYDVQKKLCECSTFSYKYTVCTQRIQFRLNSFKIIDKDSTNLTSSYKYLQSLSFEEAVYLMINMFQGFQILSQQFRINFPTSKSIGITKSGQIKVWINDNWATNDQSLFFIPQKSIIQESLKLVTQRTKGNLLKMLGIEHNYQNLTFRQVQAILSQFVIAYNNGKKTLIQRLKDVNSKLMTDTTKIRKYSLKKEKKFELQQGYTLHTPTKTKHQKHSTERRFYSNDSKHEKSKSAVVANQNYFITQENSNRFRTISQAKKQITFIYKQPQDFNVQCSQKQTFPPQMNFPQTTSNIRIPFKSQPLFNPFSKMEIKNNSFPHFQKAIERKISQNTKTITITTVNSNEQIKKEQFAVDKKYSLPVKSSNVGNKSILQISKYQNFNKGLFQNTSKTPVQERQTFAAIDYNKLLKEDKKTPKTVRFVAPELNLAQGQMKVAQVRTEEVTPQKIESINSITEQFRQLLQSDKKIQNQFDYSDEQLFQISLMSLQKSEKKLPQVEDNMLFYQKSESDIEMERPFERKCYSIKEVDEDLSYQMQSNYNK